MRAENFSVVLLAGLGFWWLAEIRTTTKVSGSALLTSVALP
jgi:hypothetical protein